MKEETTSLVPADSTPRSLSTWALRNAAGVTLKQLREFEEWGLIQQVDGRWPLDTTQKIEWISESADEARLLARRVLRLRANYIRFQVDPEIVRRAMIETLPTIDAPWKKMRQLNALVINKGLVLSARPALKDPNRAWSPPRAGEWKAILEQQPSPFKGCMEVAYRLADWIAPDLETLPSIRREEAVIMLTIRELALQRLQPTKF